MRRLLDHSNSRSSPAIGCGVSVDWFQSWSKKVGFRTDKNPSARVPPVRSAVSNGKLQNPKQYRIISVDAYKKFLSWYGGDKLEVFPVRRDKGMIVLKQDRVIFNTYYKDERRRVVFCATDDISKVKKEIRLVFGINEDIQILYKLRSGEELIYNEKTRLSEIKDDTKYLQIQYRTSKGWTSGTENYESQHQQQREEKEIEKPIQKEPEERREPEERQRQFEDVRREEPQHLRNGQILCNRRFSGKCGFSNLGNTCYFNSGIQCLVHSLPLSRILLSDEWRREINTTNPLGMKGKLVRAFSMLNYKVWEGNNISISPDHLKHVVGEFAEQFQGYSQEDPHELIMFMLDGIHEDLNRCKTKPQTETVTGNGMNDEEIAKQAWHNHKLRNDSIIVDNFHGQLRSQCICPKCNTTTVTFDPYVSISLPIAQTNDSSIDIFYIPYNMAEEYQWINVKVPSTAVISEYEKIISEKVQADVVIGFFVPPKFESPSKLFWDQESVMYSSNFNIVAFEIPDTSLYYFPAILNVKVKDFTFFQSGNNIKLKDRSFMAPFLVQIPQTREEDIQAAIESRLAYLWEEDCEAMPVHIEEEEKQVQPEDVKQIHEEEEQAQPEEVKQINEEEKTEEKEECVTKDKSLLDDLFPKTDKKRDENSNPFKKQQPSIKVASPFIITNTSSEYKNLGKLEFNDQLTEDEIKIKNVILVTKKGFKEDQRVKYDDTFPIPNNTLKHHPNVMRKMVTVTINESFMHQESGFQMKRFLFHSNNDLNKKRHIHKDTKPVTLDKCFSFFSADEVLDEKNMWFCPHCREFVCANKKMDIWSTPKCMVIHLKRFETTENGSEKDERLVEFPEVFDVKDIVIGPHGENTKYRLYAVSEHYGTLGFGHCTALATVPSQSGAREWYSYNDSNCAPSSYKKTQSSSSYVLFYERIDGEHDNDQLVAMKNRDVMERDAQRNKFQPIGNHQNKFENRQNKFDGHQNKFGNHQNRFGGHHNQFGNHQNKGGFHQFNKHQKHQFNHKFKFGRH